MKLDRGYEEIESIQKSFLDGTLSIPDRAKVLAQLGVLYGAGLLAGEIDEKTYGIWKKKHEKDLKQLESQQFRSAVIREPDEVIARKLDRAADFIFKKQSSRVKNVSNAGYINSFNTIDRELKRFDQYGLNYLNRWEVIFGNNSLVPLGESTFLSMSCQAVTIEGIEIETESGPFSFDEDIDVSNISYPSFSITFLVDSNLNVKKILHRVINEMRNFSSGAYGYKDDYKYDGISIALFNSLNVPVHVIEFKNVVISGIDSLSMDREESDLKTYEVTFDYDSFDADLF